MTARRGPAAAPRRAIDIEPAGAGEIPARIHFINDTTQPIRDIPPHIARRVVPPLDWPGRSRQVDDTRRKDSPCRSSLPHHAVSIKCEVCRGSIDSGLVPESITPEDITARIPVEGARHRAVLRIPRIRGLSATPGKRLQQRTQFRTHSRIRSC